MSKSSPPLVRMSPGKINLFLHITGQRNDGYHLLETVFQFLGFSDTLKFERLESDDIIRQDDHDFALPDMDLIIQAATLLRSRCNPGRADGVKITLSKVIPPGSGMGGGSSNAATTLMALNQLWQVGLGKNQLLALAVQLGADVPVFVHGKSCWATGTGEIFTNFAPPENWYCFCIPSMAVSTAEIFSSPDLTRNHPSISQADFFRGEISNDLEWVTRKHCPQVDQALSTLNQYGKAQMNGSGSSVFLRCDSAKQANEICQKLPADLPGFVTRSMNHIAWACPD